ncbi:fetuin-B-like [Amblyraja radiata]|uniref:fetuin-B-like n=1 Tax=Amblyraja radiata TaxID=386614 RepID=UPI0014038622|nr:fetuin-B-like [Amblyraja radiata]XP_032887953.1 fetuin-B-like [Amblyraja radiata]
MNCLVTLVTCIQLFNSHVLAFRRVVTFSAIPCDAVGAVNAADLGIHHINSVRREGYKYSLNMVTNAQEKQEQNHFIYYLEFEVFETRCHVRSPKPLKRCEIQSFNLTKAFGECKIIIHVSKGFPNVKDYHCSQYPASVGNPCQGCLYTFQPLKSGDMDHAVNIAIQKYNSKSKDISYFSLYNITKILPRSESSQMISVEFIIQETNCFKNNLMVVFSSCVPKRHKFAHLGICTVSFVPESPVYDVAEVTCEIYATKGVTVQSLSGQEEPLEDNYQDEEQKFIPKFKRSISRSKDQRMKQTGMSKECRGIVSSSSESSEEQNICSHRVPLKQPTTHRFPSLPPHALTCPGQPRYIARKN